MINLKRICQHLKGKGMNVSYVEDAIGNQIIEFLDYEHVTLSSRGFLWENAAACSLLREAFFKEGWSVDELTRNWGTCKYGLVLRDSNVSERPFIYGGHSPLEAYCQAIEATWPLAYTRISREQFNHMWTEMYTGETCAAPPRLERFVSPNGERFVIED